mmetsp:Transcript_49807/g.159167  ORF Transcript_49807/g.159167 Transcript_49807/m.159167 type:complete len:352 (+) Transcript_49807:1094-2149(+)
MIFLFVFGWPLGIFLKLRWFHRQRLVIVKLSEAGGPAPGTAVYIRANDISTVGGVDSPAGEDDEGRTFAIWRGGDAPIKLEVAEVLKSVVGDGGFITQRPVTRLDGKEARTYYQPFFQYYEDDFYWWHCYEILRRLLVTSLAIIFSIFSGGQDVPFGVFVAVLTLAAHSFFRPYVDDDDDRLHFSVLLGHFFIMYGMYLVHAGDAPSGPIGVALVACQIVPLGYALKIIVFKFSSTARDLAHSFRWRYRQFLQRRRETQFVEMAGGLQALATLHSLQQRTRRSVSTVRAGGTAEALGGAPASSWRDIVAGKEQDRLNPLHRDLAAATIQNTFQSYIHKKHLKKHRVSSPRL